MVYTDRPLENPINWSFRVGRLAGINIRVHIAFVICAVVLAWMELPPPGSNQTVSWGSVLIHAFGTYGILFAIVLLHEFGHCFGARLSGGEATEILLWPLGGLASVHPPHDPKSHMLTTLAGPTVNVIICAICSTILVAWIGRLGAVPWNPIHPMIPVDDLVIPTVGQMWVLRVFGLSYFLLLVNLLPIFPFDGGRVVQAWLWPRKGYQASMLIACSTGMIGAIGIGLFGLFAHQQWLFLMIAVFGYFNCWQTRQQLKETGYSDPYSAGLGSGDDFAYVGGRDERGEDRSGFFARRRMQKALLKARKKQEEQEVLAATIDEILRKVARDGLTSLTSRERRILEDETSRRKQGRHESETRNSDE